MGLKDVKAWQRKAKRGDMRYVRDGQVVQQQWMDCRAVTAISTIHSATDHISVNRKVKQDGQLVDISVKKPRVIEDCREVERVAHFTSRVHRATDPAENVDYT